MDEQKGMKLFVVGQPSGDPKEWNDYCETHFVIAPNRDEASRLADGASMVQEVVMDYPAVLS